MSEPSAQHGLKDHSHGGWGQVPVQTRSERFSSVNHADFPEVTGLEAEWKLTPIQRVRTLLDDPLVGERYPVHYGEVPGVQVEWLTPESEHIGQAGIPEDRAAANAWSSFSDALHIRVSEQTKPFTLTRDDLGQVARAAHTVITADAHSRALVVLRSLGQAQLSENLEIILGNGAELTFVSVQEWDADSLHLASHFARIGRGAKLTHIVVSLGGDIVRVNPSAHLAEEGADAELLGVYFADSGQHLEQRVYVHHAAPHTRSRVNYKGALNGSGARTVWVGDVLIGRAATGTDSYEQNRNLVLSDGTRADSIPNLEIETGDIAGAGHASATGRFDDEQLFYLCSRGIPELQARKLVVLGFLGEIVQRIGDQSLEKHLFTALEAELAGIG